MPDGLRPLEGTAPCAWCGEPTATARRVEYARTAQIKGKHVQIGTDRHQPCCAKCDRHLPSCEPPDLKRKREAGRAGAWKRKQEKLV